MIAKLSGVIDSILESALILDVNGVGYLVHASPRTLARIGGRGEAVSLLVDTAVREDAITLYGFADEAEQAWFRLLTSVQGVGAKAALAILAVTPPDKLGLAIASGDKAALTQAGGVGPKLAARILTELKDKAGSITESSSLQASARGGEGKRSAAEQGEGDSDLNDAVSALVNLGYGRTDAYAAVIQAKSKSNDNSNLNDLIKIALKELAS